MNGGVQGSFVQAYSAAPAGALAAGGGAAGGAGDIVAGTPVYVPSGAGGAVATDAEGYATHDAYGAPYPQGSMVSVGATHPDGTFFAFAFLQLRFPRTPSAALAQSVTGRHFFSRWRSSVKPGPQ